MAVVFKSGHSLHTTGSLHPSTPPHYNDDRDSDTSIFTALYIKYPTDHRGGSPWQLPLVCGRRVMACQGPPHWSPQYTKPVCDTCHTNNVTAAHFSPWVEFGAPRVDETIKCWWLLKPQLHNQAMEASCWEGVVTVIRGQGHSTQHKAATRIDTDPCLPQRPATCRVTEGWNEKWTNEKCGLVRVLLWIWN